MRSLRAVEDPAVAVREEDRWAIVAVLATRFISASCGELLRAVKRAEQRLAEEHVAVELDTAAYRARLADVTTIMLRADA